MSKILIFYDLNRPVADLCLGLPELVSRISGIGEHITQPKKAVAVVSYTIARHRGPVYLLCTRWHEPESRSYR